MVLNINFIDALEIIISSTDMYLCDDESERSGEHNSICVYSSNNQLFQETGGIIGKIYFCNINRLFKPEISSELEGILKDRAKRIEL